MDWSEVDARRKQDEDDLMYYRPKSQVESRSKTQQQTPPLPPQDSSLAKPSTKPGAEPQAPGQNDQDMRERVMRLEGVYIISVAARILDMHPQTLRKYERLGLINPGRTIGMLRLYSAEDIRTVRLIRHLVDNMGFNMAGVEHTLGMVDALLEMKQRLIAYAKSSPMADLIEQEIARIFRDMNLPVEE